MNYYDRFQMMAISLELNRLIIIIHGLWNGMLQLYGMNQKQKVILKQMGLLQKIKENKMGEFNEAQVAAIKHKKGPMLVLAGAGFRKNYSINISY